MAKNILIFCAHSDDESLGMGGTIAKYVAEGKKVIVVIFSYGEASLPHLKPEYVKEIRLKEIEEASKLLGTQEAIFLGLPDAKLKEYEGNREVITKVRKIIRKYNPEKIFTHSQTDPHHPGDHKAVHNIVTKAVKGIKKEYDLFNFEVWNIFPENRPVMYVDISKYFKKKIKAISIFKSQWFSILLTIIPIYIRAKKFGLKAGYKYAEKFYKIR